MKDTQKSPKKILFICTGNICRSPLAHKLFERLLENTPHAPRMIVDSCGTGAWHEGQNADPRMIEVAAERGWPLEKFSREIRNSDLEEFDFLIAMDRSHKHYIEQMAYTRTHPNTMEKVVLLREYDKEGKGEDVPDPYYGGITGFEKVYDTIERSCIALLKDIISQHE